MYNKHNKKIVSKKPIIIEPQSPLFQKIFGQKMPAYALNAIKDNQQLKPVYRPLTTLQQKTVKEKTNLQKLQKQRDERHGKAISMVRCK